MEKVNKNGVKFIIGRNAEENEYLTQKYRKDKNSEGVLWFHIDAHPGPHVIVIPDELNGICGNDIQEAANYAVTYAKKDNMLVCYCKIQDLKKDKKDKVGTFIIKNESKIKGYNINNT